MVAVITPQSSHTPYAPQDPMQAKLAQQHRIGTGESDMLGDVTNRQRTNASLESGAKRQENDTVDFPPKKEFVTFYDTRGKLVVARINHATGKTTAVAPTEAQMAAREAAYEASRRAQTQEATSVATQAKMPRTVRAA